MNEKNRVIPSEMAFVIIYDADAETFFLQQKDCTYWMETFRHKYNFFGTGLIPGRREMSLMALQRKLAKEMPDAEEKITDEMRFWKMFRLPWGADVEGNYTAHVYVMMLTSRYKMMDLISSAGRGGIKRGSLAHINIDRIEQMIANRDFMGSLDIVAGEFLKKIKANPEEFWGGLPVRKM